MIRGQSYEGPLVMSAMVSRPRPQCDEPSEHFAGASADEFARVRAENERLRELVVQLSRLVVQGAIARK
jgi:hypothetical protein